MFCVRVEMGHKNKSSVLGTRKDLKENKVLWVPLR